MRAVPGCQLMYEAEDGLAHYCVCLELELAAEVEEVTESEEEPAEPGVTLPPPLFGNLNITHSDRENATATQRNVKSHEKNIRSLRHHS